MKYIKLYEDIDFDDIVEEENNIFKFDIGDEVKFKTGGKYIVPDFEFDYMDNESQKYVKHGSVVLHKNHGIIKYSFVGSRYGNIYYMVEYVDRDRNKVCLPFEENHLEEY